MSKRIVMMLALFMSLTVGFSGFSHSLPARKKIVIGENMERVDPYAKKIGAEVYEGLPGFKPGMEAKGLLHNQQVIQKKMAEGYQIIDIGPDFGFEWSILVWCQFGRKDSLIVATRSDYTAILAAKRRNA